MYLKRIMVLGASMVALALVTTSCGSTGGPSSSASPKGTVTVASFNFSESIILAHIYGGALKNKGYTVVYRDKLGNREIVEPALENGQIDLYPGYAATDLTFVEKKQGVAADAGTDAQVNVQKLNAVLSSKDFKALDPGGPLTYAAFKSGAINIGLVFSSDGGITANNLVVLEDDKHLQQADNIVPLIRTAVANSEVTSLLNSIDAKLNTPDLTAMNKSADVDN